jgi:cytoskeletal protein CcmA (bactofilin family)
LSATAISKSLAHKNSPPRLGHDFAIKSRLTYNSPIDMTQDAHSNTVPGRSEASTIGEDLTIIGDVTSKGELRIDGRVHGNVHCLSLILGEKSEIEGDVKAEEVLIRGRLIGSVRGHRIMLQSTAHVEGDLLHRDLAMEQGAYFEGESRRCEDPLAAAQPRQKPQVAAGEAQPRRVEHPKPSTAFVRSLQKSDSI